MSAASDACEVEDAASVADCCVDDFAVALFAVVVVFVVALFVLVVFSGAAAGAGAVSDGVERTGPCRRFFRIRSSRHAWSSMFRASSLATNEDMPASSCSSGSATALSSCSVRSVAKATRAHSTVARHCALGVAGADDAALLAVFMGDVATRLRVRGWRGVVGADMDRRRRLFAVELDGASAATAVAAADATAAATSSPVVCTRAGVLGTVASAAAGLAASASAFRAALITCVASCAFSLSERPGCTSGCCRASLRAAAAVAGRRLAAAVPGRDEAAVAGREEGAAVPRVVFAIVGAGCGCDSASRGRRRDLRETTVAGVQVEPDATAVRTASTCAWKDAMSCRA